MFDKLAASKVVKSIPKGKTAIFVGAGVAVEAGLPNWKQALENLSHYIEEHDPLLANIMVDRINKKIIFLQPISIIKQTRPQKLL